MYTVRQKGHVTINNQEFGVGEFEIELGDTKLDNIDYSVSKAGVINMTKGISMATSNKVICICPNWIDSDSTNDMDSDYLNSELKRIGQSRLIKMKEFIDSFVAITSGEIVSGDIYRIDVKDDKLWVEKMY